MDHLAGVRVGLSGNDEELGDRRSQWRCVVHVAAPFAVRVGSHFELEVAPTEQFEVREPRFLQLDAVQGRRLDVFVLR